MSNMSKKSGEPVFGEPDLDNIMEQKSKGFLATGGENDRHECKIPEKGLPVGFLLLRYSVLFTVESLSLLYLLVIS